MSGISTLSDVLAIFLHSASLSLMAVGGGITLLPEFHRFLVAEKLWISDLQFTSAVALAQSSPGPNILFVSLLGWNAGFNGGGYAYALLSGIAAMLGIIVPSTTLTLLITRWAHRTQEMRILRAFKQGMAPLVIALLFATVWVLVSANDVPARDWKLWALSAVSFVVLWRTKVHLLWLLGTGAVLGGFGLV